LLRFDFLKGFNLFAFLCVEDDPSSSFRIALQITQIKLRSDLSKKGGEIILRDHQCFAPLICTIKKNRNLKVKLAR